MSSSTLKRSGKQTNAAGARAARQAEAVAKLLYSFAASLKSLNDLTPTAPTPRDWWRTQAGRFKDDPSFPDFVAKVRAARKRED